MVSEEKIEKLLPKEIVFDLEKLFERAVACCVFVVVHRIKPVVPDSSM